MKHITKRIPPVSFDPWKLRKHYTKVELQAIPDLINSSKKNVLKKNSIWKDFTQTGRPGVNGDVKRSLLDEQGYICCYCMSRIELDDITIEHIESRSAYPTNMFDYNSNLLGSCNGGEQDPKPKESHCGASKANQTITVHPLQTDCHIHFKFDEEGKIYGVSEDGIDTIKKLGLDIAKLRSRRRIAIESVLPPEIELTKEEILLLVDSMGQRTDNMFYPYCQTIISILS